MGLGMIDYPSTHMHYYKAFGLTIQSEIELPELSEAPVVEISDIQVRETTFTLPRFRKTKIYRRGIQAGFGQDEDGALYLHWDGVGTYKAIGGDTLLFAPDTDDANLISLFTVSEALGLLLFQRGYFLLHASAVVVGNEAWCFMGAPGAGKSTTAAAFVKAGCRLLSDDLTAIELNADGDAYIIPAYPQLKIWDATVNGLDYDRAVLSPVSEGVNKFSYQPKSEFLHGKVPLRRVFFMHKAKNRPAWQEINAAEVPMELIKNFPLPTRLLEGANLKQHFMQSFQCSRNALMGRKRRPDGFAALEKWVQESIESQLQTS